MQPRLATGQLSSQPLIRELTAADRRAVAFYFRRLGPGSREQRFLRATPELSDRELERVLRVDHWHHEGLIAWSPVPRAPIGVAEYVRLEEFDLAEPAIAVVDAWQRHDIGRQLMDELRRRAIAAGIRCFMATTLRSNRGALALARELGTCTAVGSYRNTVELRIELSVNALSHLPTASATAPRSLVKP